MTIALWLLKIGIAVVDTPIVYGLVWLLDGERCEGRRVRDCIETCREEAHLALQCAKVFPDCSSSRVVSINRIIVIGF